MSKGGDMRSLNYFVASATMLGFSQTSTAQLILQFDLSQNTTAQVVTEKSYGEIDGSPYDIFLNGQHLSRAIFGPKIQVLSNDSLAGVGIHHSYLSVQRRQLPIPYEDISVNGWLRYADPYKSNLAGITNTVIVPNNLEHDSSSTTVAFQYDRIINGKRFVVLELADSTHQIEVRNGKPILGRSLNQIDEQTK
jgi:hypothetical protein